MARRRNGSMTEAEANTVIAQMGGYGKLRVMLGPKLAFLRGSSPEGYPMLVMRFPNPRGPSVVHIVIDPSDTYTVSFFRPRGTQVHPKGSYSGIYADGLKHLIERETGLRLSLRNGRRHAHGAVL